MSNLQLFPVSSLLIGSMLPMDIIAHGAPAPPIGAELHLGPREPDWAYLFRLLESNLCSVREHSCY